MEIWERKRCSECGALLSANPNRPHSEEFCIQWRMFPLLERVPQSTIYALAELRKRVADIEKRNAAVMRAMANAPTRFTSGIPHNSLKPYQHAVYGVGE